MKVLYLFNGSRHGLLEKVARGEEHGNGFWGMLGLRKRGIQADFIELEQAMPLGLARLLRRHVNVYFIHVPLFLRILRYDIVYTSAAFGSQFIHALWPFKKPLWVMHDFSVMSLLGDGSTLRQKMFAWMLSRAAGVVTLSANEKERLEARFPELKGRVEHIPFGIDLEFFKRNDAAIQRSVLSVGRDPDRDWGTFLKAVDGIQAPVSITTWKSRIERFSPLPDNVTVLDLSARRLVEEYAKASVVVISLDTSHGNNDAMGCSALFEAMSMGKAIIATRTRAMESYVTDGVNGILVPEGDPVAMREAIERLLADEGLRRSLADAAHRYALEYLDASVCDERLASFFRRVLSLRKETLHR